jgi:hypothetical protein
MPINIKDSGSAQSSPMGTKPPGIPIVGQGLIADGFKKACTEIMKDIIMDTSPRLSQEKKSEEPSP